MIFRSAARAFSRPHNAKVWLTACVALVGASLVPLASGLAVGTLAFTAEIDIAYPPVDCPPGTPGSVACFTRTGVSLVPGLGKVEESYAYLLDERPAGCPTQDHVRGLPSTARLTVVGKGTIEIRVSGTDCLLRLPPNPLTGSETFTVTGGSGRFAGASGSGTIAHVSNGLRVRGTDTWSGTLDIPAVVFDLTPPVIRGAVAKAALAPRGAQRAHVRFAVSATDVVDGSVAVACTPKSGSSFRIGRTTVRCAAMDSSANSKTARFTITVAKAQKNR